MTGLSVPTLLAATAVASFVMAAALAIVAGAGHAVPLERAADCAAALDEFLERSIEA